MTNDRHLRTLARAHELLKAGQLAEAARLTQDLAQAVPDEPRAWYLLSQIAQRGGNASAALGFLERAISCAPSEPTYLLAYGQYLATAGRRREALTVAAQLTTLELRGAAMLDALGTLYAFCNEAERAFSLFARAVGEAPGNPAYLYNLSTAQRMLGRIDEAERSLDRVIACKPDDYGAYYTRSDLRTQTLHRNHIDAIRNRLSGSNLPRPAQITLCFALAKELEDVGDYTEAFATLKRGCDLQRRTMAYDVREDVATINRLIELHTPAAISHDKRGFASTECIFVIGLPRSGTTLVERIIGAHSQVFAAGELHAFQQQIVQAVARHCGRPVSKLEFVERSLEIDPGELGRGYLEETRPQTGHTPRFIDKNPLNYLYAGLIRRALPQARFIALQRDPMDSCYAMYKTLFTGAYPFSYDLTDLGLYYQAWFRLLSHWRTVLGEALLLVRYEDLVVNQESVSRQMIQHCGLDWEPACLRFNEQTQAVTTASAVQVRKPIYSSSVGKWRHYAEQLDELRHSLGGLGDVSE